MILDVAGQNKQWIIQKLLKTMVDKSIKEYFNYNISDINDDNKIIDSHVQSDALISYLLVHYYLLTDPKDGL